MSFLRSNDISLAEPLLDGSAIMRAAVCAAKLSSQTFLLKLKIDSIGECGRAGGCAAQVLCCTRESSWNLLSNCESELR